MADEPSRAPGGRGTDGKGTPGDGRGGRRRANEMVSWVVVGAMMIVGAGAVGYMYVHNRGTPTSGFLHGAGRGGRGSAAAAKGTGGRTPAAKSGHPGTPATNGASKSGVKATAYYPPIGTPTRPVDGSVIEPFGWQYEKAIGLYRDVPGWALAADRGEPVRAVVGGRVVANWVDPTEGREVVVNSRNGDSIIYGDLASPGPAAGTSIKAGEVFARVGPSGKLSGVTQPHLFLEVTVGGQPVSPSVLLGSVPGADATANAAPPGRSASAKA